MTRKLIVVVRDDVRAAAEALIADRNGGPAFTTALTRNGRDAAAWLASWWRDAVYEQPWGDEQGRFDLRAVLEGHPALAGKLRANLIDDGDGRRHAIDPATPPRWAVFDGWDQPAALDELGVTRLEEAA